MTIILGMIASLLAVGALAYALAKMKTQAAAQSLRITLGVVGVIAGALLTVRGLAVIGVPLAGAALGLLGVALRGGAAPGGAAGDRGGSRPERTGRMSRRDAARMLGVAETADETEINAAYKALMKKVHPDAGGNDALAAQVQEARDVLLGKR